MQVRIGKTVIEIVQGDIVAQDTDAVVNAANNYLWMGSGVAGAIKAAGGEAIEEEATSQGPIPVGSSVITGAGELPARFVIHAAGMGQDLKTDEDNIRKAVTSAMELAVERKLESMAFPAIGTGVGVFPLQKAAHIMLDAALELLLESVGSDGMSLKLVRFVLFDEETFTAFRSELARRFSS